MKNVGFVFADKETATRFVQKNKLFITEVRDVYGIGTVYFTADPDQIKIGSAKSIPFEKRVRVVRAEIKEDNEPVVQHVPEHHVIQMRSQPVISNESVFIEGEELDPDEELGDEVLRRYAERNYGKDDVVITGVSKSREER